MTKAPWPRQERSGWKRSVRENRTIEPPIESERSYSVADLEENAVGDYNPIPPEDRRVRVLDVFCGPGGVGVALREVFSQPNMAGAFAGIDSTDYGETYPGRFYQMDATTLSLDSLGLSEKADLVWLSPPCRAYSPLSHVHHENPKEVYPTIPELGVRQLAKELGRHYVIENVPACDDLDDSRTVSVNGAPFDHQLNYRRKFEVSFFGEFYAERYEGDQRQREGIVPTGTANRSALAEAKHIPEAAEWTEQEARSAIPPQYVAFVLSHCPSLPEVAPPGGVEDYYGVTREPGQPTLFSFD